MPFGDRTADVVITINALDHVQGAVAVMSEGRRILTPGGTFIGSSGLRELPTATESLQTGDAGPVVPRPTSGRFTPTAA